MNLQIESKEQLEYILNLAIKQYEDCVIHIKNKKLPVDIICTKISDNATLMALYSDKGTKHVSDAISNDYESKMEWVNDIYLSRLDNSYGDNFSLDITIKQDKNSVIKDVNLDEEFEDGYNINSEGYYDIEDYREEYLSKHNIMRINQKPIAIRKFNEIAYLFSQFLLNDKCDKLIFSFSTIIKDLNHTFIIDLVIDKLYVYGRTLISFIITRPDMGDIEFTNPTDCIYEFKYKNKENNKELVDTLRKHVNTSNLRCTLVSNHNKVRVDAYSNINFKEK